MTQVVRSKSRQNRYSEHLETLIALVTHLGLTYRRSRTPTMLAKYLGLEKAEVQKVLSDFKGLFRESVSVENGEHFYTLQIRYARRWLDETESDSDDDDTVQRPPLAPEHIAGLLSFVSRMVEQEQTGARQRARNWFTLAGAWIAAAAAIAAAIIALVK